MEKAPIGSVAHKTIEKLALEQGLKESTVEDLLLSGWQFNVTIHEMPKWQRPLPQGTMHSIDPFPTPPLSTPQETQ